MLVEVTFLVILNRNKHIPLHLRRYFYDCVWPEQSCTRNAHPPYIQSSIRPASSPRRQHPLREISFKLTVIIRELLHSDSLGSFLSLFLHICALIQPASRPSVSQHLSKQEVAFSPQIFLRPKETPTQWMSSFCVLFLTNLFFLYYSFCRCLSFLVISSSRTSAMMSLFIFRKDVRQRPEPTHCLITINTIPYQLHPFPQWQRTWYPHPPPFWEISLHGFKRGWVRRKAICQK